MSPVRAAVDCGTNTVRLLVLDGDGRPLAREMVITRLGQGVDATNRLHPDALARTLDAMRAHRTRWEALGASSVRIAATSAVRDAENRDAFFDGVREATGVEAEVLSGEEEARTAFLGAVAGPDAVAVPWPPVVVDIGGGSTELIVGGGTPDAPEVAGAVSLQLGSVRLTERALDPAARPDGTAPTAAQRREAHDLARTRVAEGVAVLLSRGVDVVRVAAAGLGVAGTVTTLAMVDRGLEAWEDGCVHGHVLTRAAVRRITGHLEQATPDEVAAIAAIAPGRREVIAAGAIVLDEVMEVLGLREVHVSEADILDGLARTA